MSVKVAEVFPLQEVFAHYSDRDVIGQDGPAPLFSAVHTCSNQFQDWKMYDMDVMVRTQGIETRSSNRNDVLK